MKIAWVDKDDQPGGCIEESTDADIIGFNGRSGIGESSIDNAPHMIIRKGIEFIFKIWDNILDAWADFVSRSKCELTYCY